MKKMSWQVLVALALFIFGILAMTQYTAEQSIVRNSVSNLRSEDIIGTLIQVEQDSENMRKEADSLEKRIKEYQQSNNLSKSLEDELAATKMRAGLEGLKGPGLIVTLSDSEKTHEQGTDPNNYFIHESFLREIVNAFWTGGAEGVAVNDLRLIANSEIFCGGTTIFINKVLVAPPYKIMAVGEARALSTSINMDVMPLLSSLEQRYGIKVDVQEVRVLSLPPYREKLQFHFSTPLT
jgi:uncharacterized protein YlxW (UPF0749 family)